MSSTHTFFIKEKTSLEISERLYVSKNAIRVGCVCGAKNFPLWKPRHARFTRRRLSTLSTSRTNNFVSSDGGGVTSLRSATKTVFERGNILRRRDLVRRNAVRVLHTDNVSRPFCALPACPGGGKLGSSCLRRMGVRRGVGEGRSKKKP